MITKSYVEFVYSRSSCHGQRTHANGKTPSRLKSSGVNLPIRFRKKGPFINKKKNKKTQKNEKFKRARH